MKRLWVNALADERTGIGLVQRELHRALQDRWDLVEGRKRPLSVAAAGAHGIRGAMKTISEVRFEAWPDAPGADAALLTKPPYPMRELAPVQVLIVYDLRWRRVRSRAAAQYRSFNLRAAVRRATAVACISRETRDELVRFLPDCTNKTHVVHLGPGRPRPASPPMAVPGTRADLLIAGGAPHKGLGSLVRAVVEMDPEWVAAVTLLNPSIGDEALVDRLRATGRLVRVVNNPSDTDLWTELSNADVVASMSTEEGFGFMPFEALRAGADVVVADVPLSHELFDGIAGVAIRSVSDPTWLRHRPKAQSGIPAEARYSWKRAVTQIEALLGSDGRRD